MQTRWHLHQEPSFGPPASRSNRCIGTDVMSADLAIIRCLVQAYAVPKPPVSENLDWKQKYRDSLLEMEAEEKRWREVEQVLRRLIGRLCAAGMGVDPQLDDELTVLAAANRRNAGAMGQKWRAES